MFHWGIAINAKFTFLVIISEFSFGCAAHFSILTIGAALIWARTVLFTYLGLFCALLGAALYLSIHGTCGQIVWPTVSTCMQNISGKLLQNIYWEMVFEIQRMFEIRRMALWFERFHGSGKLKMAIRHILQTLIRRHRRSHESGYKTV